MVWSIASHYSIKYKGPRPGFEPERRDPQSLMLPDYTTSAMQWIWLIFNKGVTSIYFYDIEFM